MPMKALVFLSLAAFGLALQNDTDGGGTVNFIRCLAEVQDGKWGSIGGTDSSGNLVDNSQATGMTYNLCLEACGSGQEPFVWRVFSQHFSSWLLPWLALISQLPFGSDDKFENAIAVALTVGSPALAAYSLLLTVLNGRWISRRFSHYPYPNYRQASIILNSLQQSPIKVTTEEALLASLVVLPENDAWWAELPLWLEQPHTWSIAAATSIAWVLIAFAFTIVDSFTGTITSEIQSNGQFTANGQSVGSLWLWLLPIVIAWLLISPQCDSTRVQQAIDRANEIAYVSTAAGDPIPASSLSSRRALSLHQGTGTLHSDAACSSPVYNYARFLPWSQAAEIVFTAFREASMRAADNQPVDPQRTWAPGNRDSRVHPVNRRGTHQQVDAYCPSSHSASRWASGVKSRFIIASLLALALQWGTVGAAILVVYLTPTVGLGCRSGSYIVYGASATVVWMLLVMSSVLAHYATPPAGKHHLKHQASFATHAATLVSVFTRRLGKVIAVLNTIWILVVCIVFQFGNFFDRCFCNSSWLGLREKAYTVIQLVPSEQSGLKAAWGGGVLLATGVALIFVGFTYTFMDSKEK